MIKTEFFKEKEGMAAIIAVVLGLLLIMSKTIVTAITNVAPWMVLFIFFIFLILLIFGLFGSKEKDFMDALKYNNNQLLNIIMGIGIAIVSLSFIITMIGKSTEATQEFMASLFTDMRILGIMFLFILIFVTILLLTMAEAPIKPPSWRK